MTVYAHLRWVKSSASQSNDCVEWAVEPSGDRIFVRNSTDPTGPVIPFTLSEWRAFVIGVKQGEADL